MTAPSTGGSRRRVLLTGVVLGLVIGTVTGLLGALLDWPMWLRGAVMGVLLAIGFATVLRRASLRQ